jgi:anaerobic selenocysteine-containing dehydrogenase
MRRVGKKGGGEFEPMSWDEAITVIAGRLKDIAARWGGEAILPYHYGGSNGLMTDGFLDDLFFARLGASRLAKTVCAAPATAAAVGMYGKMAGVAFEDYVHAKCIIVWGANPKVSNIHLVPFLREAKQRGAFVAAVDPIRNLSTVEADLHLAVKPGTDLPVALAIVRLLREEGRLDDRFLSQHAKSVDPLLEAADSWPIGRAAAEAGVTPQQLERIAREYADSAPAVIRCGWGVERNSNGGQAVAAILALPALLGKFGVRGGGYTLSNSGAVRMATAKLCDVSQWSTRVINMTQLGEVLGNGCEPPVKSLFVYNCNPAVTVPDQNAVLRGLAREDLFTVVFEQVMTDSAMYADVLLPATTFLEHRDIRVSYGNYIVGGVKPALAPRGEARSNPQLFAAIGRAMGFTDDAFQWDDETCLQRLSGAIELAGVAADPTLLVQGQQQRCEFPGGTPIQFATVLPMTSDGKIDMCPTVLGDEPYSYRPLDSSRYPLRLVSPATAKLISSTLGEFNLPKLWVSINPNDASPRHIASGDEVRVFNELGEVVCTANVTAKVRPGVALIPKGAWRKSSRNGMTATALCPANVNVVGGGACYNDARVEVEGGSGERGAGSGR